MTFDLAGCSTASAGQIVPYAINDTTQSEAGWGTYFSSTPSLTRGSSLQGLKSTNSNSPINMTNTAQVFITPSYNDLNTGVAAAAFLGLQINGDHVVSLENGSNAVTGIALSAPTYITDGWYISIVGGVTNITGQRITTTPPTGFQYSLRATVTNPDAAVAAGDLTFISQKIEGYRTAKLGWGATGSLPITVCFWVRSSATGTYGVSVKNNAANRSYVQTISISAANTWEYKTLIFPGDTSGTWDTTTNTGIQFSVCLMGGTTYQGSAGAWAASNIYTTSAQTNWCGTNGNTFDITGLLVFPGYQLISSDQLQSLMRPFDVEVLSCQRYFQNVPSTGTIWKRVDNLNSANQRGDMYIPFQTQMRATPTMTTSISTGSGAIAMWISNVTPTVSGDIDGFYITATDAGAASTILRMTFAWEANSRL